jgi:hypothetical protein
LSESGCSAARQDGRKSARTGSQKLPAVDAPHDVLPKMLLV